MVQPRKTERLLMGPKESNKTKQTTPRGGGTRNNFKINGISLSKDRFFFLANNVDHDEMPHYVAFQLGIHCLPN